MDEKAIKKLKILLKEDTYPYFDDDALEIFLDENENDVYKTASELCLLKADSEKSIKVGPITIENPDPEFWKDLSIKYKAKSQEIAAKEGKSTGVYSNRIRRLDDYGY